MDADGGSPLMPRRRVGGSPVFVAAHGMHETRPDFAFEQALALARLVLEHHGGPVPASVKRALADRKTVRALTGLGLVEQSGVWEVTPAFEVHSVPGVWQPQPNGHTPYDVSVRVHGAHQREQWHVRATETGVALVLDHVPRPPRIPGPARPPGPGLQLPFAQLDDAALLDADDVLGLFDGPPGDLKRSGTADG